MKHVKTEELIHIGSFSESEEWHTLRHEIHRAIERVVWPPGSDEFRIYPEMGKKRGEGNGVRPIKDAFVDALEEFGWEAEERLKIGNVRRAGKIDAIKRTSKGIFAVEWETGNISSSHRSLNKMALGIIQDILIGGALVLPTRKMYRYLTDRIGNFQEIAPYFPMWKEVCPDEGVLVVMGVEHDAEDPSVPRIKKGTDGRAMI